MTSPDDPRWISLEQVIAIQQQTILKQGGSPGIRDQGLLESALARPQNHYSFGEEDIFMLAATYAEGLARNHAFVDGNKRAAYITAGMFLRNNGFHFDIHSVPDQIALFEKLAQGILSRRELADFYRDNCRNRPAR